MDMNTRAEIMSCLCKGVQRDALADVTRGRGRGRMCFLMKKSMKSAEWEAEGSVGDIFNLITFMNVNHTNCNIRYQQ